MPGALRVDTKWGLATLAVGTAVAIGLVPRWNSRRVSASRGPAGNVTNAASQSAPATLAAPTPLTFGLRPGMRYSYAFERKIALHGLGSRNPVIAYQGELDIDVSDAGPWGSAALASAKIFGNAGGDSPALRIRMDPTGESLQAFGQAPVISEQGREKLAILKDLLSNWDFALLTDTVGPFDARFEDLPADGTLLRRKKTKLRYEAAAKAPVILSSTHVLEWDSALSAPRKIQGEESTRMGIGNAVLSSQSSYAIRLLSVHARSALPASALARFESTEELSLSTPSSAAASSGPRLRPTRSWASILGDLEDFSSLNRDQQLQIFGDLAQALKADGNAPASTVALLQSADVIRLGAASPLFQAVVGALATAGSPAAQSAAIQIYQDPDCPVSGKGSILAALTTTQAVLEPSTRQFLADTMQGESNPDLSNGAAFALGASLQRAPDDEQSAQAVALIAQSWTQAAGNSSQQLALLDAMGNSGRADYLPTIDQVIDGSSDPAARAKAVFALRFMPGAAPAELLTQSLSDPSAQVRQASVSAMGLAAWNEAFRSPLQGCAAGEPVAAIQSACQAVLARAGGS